MTTHIKSISMDNLKADALVFFFWTNDYRNRYPNYKIKSVTLEEPITHWARYALAVGTLTDGLFVYIEPYDRDFYDKISANKKG